MAAKISKEAHEAALRRELIDKILAWKFGKCALVAEERIATMRQTLAEQSTEVLIRMDETSLAATIREKNRKLRLNGAPF